MKRSVKVALSLLGFALVIGLAGCATSATTTPPPPIPPVISTNPLPPAGVIGSAYPGFNFTVASGGTAPFAWSEMGALPPGMALNGGALSGTPTMPGPFNINVTVTDQSSPQQSGSHMFTITVNNPPPPVISTSPLPPAGMTNIFYPTFSFTVASGGLAPFTWSEQGALPPGMSFNAGVLSGTPTATGASNIGVFVTDSSVPPQTGQQAFSIAVGVPLAAYFTVAVPPFATAGSPFNLIVTAFDAANNVVTSYSGTVHFTSTDGQASLPADSMLTNGTGTANFPATLKTAGNTNITATDTVANSITGTSNSIIVSASAATRFTVTAPATATGGSLFSFTVTAFDAFGNVATGYSGTVHFTSTDLQAVLPADSMLMAGTGTTNFPATLKSTGNWTITATDTVTATITGASNTIAVSAATPENPVPFISQPLGPDAAAPGGAGFTLMVEGTGFVAGSVVKWNGASLVTNFLSTSKLSANVPAANLVAANTASVTVDNPAPGGGPSNVVFFGTTTSSPAVAFGTPSPLTAGSRPNSIATGDFNGDGKLDLVTANLGSNNISVLLGNGDGTFHPAVSYPIGSSPLGVAVGDFNGDGKLDLVATNGGGQTVSVLLGNGDGTFQPAVNYGAGSQPEAIAVGDFNGDGKLDLAVANFGSNNVSVLLGNGDGTFQAALEYGAGAGPFTIALGDLNGDGKLDLVIADFQASSVSVLLGNGDGTFQPAVNYSAGGGPESVAVADFNGDGKLDLVTANISTNNVSILLGNGNGTFQPAVSYAVGSTPASVAVGDLNGDGKLDLAVANDLGHNTSVLLGNGDGTFQAAVNSGSGGLSIALGDFNGDGRLDVVVADSNISTISVALQETTVGLSPANLSFNNELLNTTSAVQPVMLTNTGGLPLNFTGISIIGTNPGDFGETQNCGSTLAPGASCTINVTFAPTQVGPRSATISIVDDSPSSPQTIALTGIGQLSGGNALLLPASLTFAPQVTNTTSGSQTVTLGNYGTITLNISGIAASTNFGETNSCAASLAPLATCTINVTFTPTAVGNLAGTLSVTDDAPASPQSIPLNGIGAGITTATLTPSGLSFFCSFPHGPVGGCTPPERATLTNTGTETMYIHGITISPSGPFSQVNNCPSSLNAGQSCTITVSFFGTVRRHPPTVYHSTLFVNDTATGSPQQVSLTGTAH